MTKFYDRILTQLQVQSLSKVFGDTSRGFTKTELTNLLCICNIPLEDDGSKRDYYSCTRGLSKKDWLYNCFVAEYNRSREFSKIFLFIETALNPIAFTQTDNREKYSYLFEEINKILMLSGLYINKSGKLEEVTKAKTLDEADRRVNELSQKLYQRSIHSEVTKYCKKDYLRRDYYDVVFEASKGLFQRIRDMSGETLDGSRLIQKVFNIKEPVLLFNGLSDESERNEYNGFRELLESITHLVRNPVAHTPKINWKSNEIFTLDVLTLISFAHKYLDECFIVK